MRGVQTRKERVGVRQRERKNKKKKRGGGGEGEGSGLRDCREIGGGDGPERDIQTNAGWNIYVKQEVFQFIRENIVMFNVKLPFSCQVREELFSRWARSARVGVKLPSLVVYGLF